MDKEAYRCFLYKQVDGKTQSHIFVGETAVNEALADGWHTTFADFVDQADTLTEGEKAVAKDVCSIAVGDFNILANADDIEDLDKLIDAYERASEKKLHHKAKTLKGVRKAIHKLLGDLDGNSATVN